MRVTVHLVTGENVELDINPDQVEAVQAALAMGYPRTFSGALWRRKGSTSTGVFAVTVVAHVVHLVVHRASIAEVIERATEGAP
jgi:hypothetical protein